MITLLIRMANRGSALNSLERVLAQGEASPEALARMQAALTAEDLAAETILLTAARGERAVVHGILGRIADGQLTVEEIGGSPRPDGGPARFWNWLWVRPLARKNQAYALDFMTRLAEATRLPFTKQVDKFEQLTSELRDTKESAPHLMLARLLLPALDKVARAHYRSRARLNCAEAAVAAERFRRDHKRWPDSLEQLVPKYLTMVPDDLLDEGTLLLRKERGLLVLHSAGTADVPEDIEAMSEGDLVEKAYLHYGFRLWDVNQRRQHPPPTPEDALQP